MTDQADIQRRILFILHRGLVELRLLAKSGMNRQAFDLADALEELPARLSRWEDRDLDWVRDVLRAYEAQHPQSFRYIQFLTDMDPPADF